MKLITCPVDYVCGHLRYGHYELKLTEEEFADTMKELHTEFSQLNEEALKLQEEIDKNLKELFGEG